MKQEKMNMITFRVDKVQKKAIHKLLAEIKKKNRYTYPEIITTALKSLRATL